jgi:hypothetical protein
VEALLGDPGQEGFLVCEVPVGSRLRDAGQAGNRTQSQRFRALGLHDMERRIQERRGQVAVMVSVRALGPAGLTLGG